MSFFVFKHHGGGGKRLISEGEESRGVSLICVSVWRFFSVEERETNALAGINPAD